MPPAALSLVLLHAGAVVAAAAIALWLRPWRTLGGAAPPWPWLALWAALPLLWGLDRHAAIPLLPALSGAPMLMLMAGWPLAVLAMLGAALVTALAADLGAADALQRLVWLGLVPATVALALGAAVRRWLPHHLFVYILGRGFFATLAAVVLSGAAASLVQPAPADLDAAQRLVAHILTAFGEAFLTGMGTAILVAFRPAWLATYSDHLYLPAPPRE